IRQINYYHFQKVNRNYFYKNSISDEELNLKPKEFSNKNFIRDKPELLKNIKRKKTNVTESKIHLDIIKQEPTDLLISNQKILKPSFLLSPQQDQNSTIPFNFSSSKPLLSPPPSEDEFLLFHPTDDDNFTSQLQFQQFTTLNKPLKSNFNSSSCKQLIHDFDNEFNLKIKSRKKKLKIKTNLETRNSNSSSQQITPISHGENSMSL
ncbi:hypothetical protein HK099_003459, partial [Clydaea vesicula]